MLWFVWTRAAVVVYLDERRGLERSRRSRLYTPICILKYTAHCLLASSPLWRTPNRLRGQLCVAAHLARPSYVDLVLSLGRLSHVLALVPCFPVLQTSTSAADLKYISFLSGYRFFVSPSRSSPNLLSETARPKEFRELQLDREMSGLSTQGISVRQRREQRRMFGGGYARIALCEERRYVPPAVHVLWLSHLHIGLQYHQTRAERRARQPDIATHEESA